MTSFEATRQTDESGIPYLRVSGALDLAAAPQLIEAALTSGLLRLDLSEVEFMDSTGLGALITLRNTAHERGDEMELLTVSRAVQRVFALSGLEDVFGAANGSADG
jgi:anti-anti-sigma factor